jgi:hypothetical protein
VIISGPATTPASEAHVAREVLEVLDRRAAMARPPASVTVSGAVALGIAAQYRSASLTGQVLDRFSSGGSVDSDELIKAARFEQGFASPEGYAALRCLVLWVQDRTQRSRRARRLAPRED